MVTIEDLRERWFNAYPEVVGITGNKPIQCYAKKDVDDCLAGNEAVPHTGNSAVIAKLLDERRWRKFPDEKPKWGVEVLVVDDESKQHIVRFSHDMKWISWGKMNTCESNCVKYWMPLPSAPKEDK